MNLLVDTHAHIDGEEFAADRQEVIQRAKEAGVHKIIDFGDSLASSRRAAAVSREYEAVFCGVGVHPESAAEMSAEVLNEIASLAEAEDKVIAIGEIGLDYYWVKDEDTRLLQRQVFIQQLDLARQLHLPVCIHDRDAHGDTLKILQQEGRGLNGVLHCYSGSYETAKEFLKLGWYLGVDGPLTFKNAARLPEILRQLPLERILVETDCPYLTPVPYRGKRNEPAYVQYVAQKAAEIRGEDFALFAAATTQNAHDLYGLKTK